METNIIKEYLKFYERYYKREIEGLANSPIKIDFKQGKIYEMNLVMRDLKRMLEGDIFFVN